MSIYSEFFLNSSSKVVELELIEIAHPNFTSTKRLVRNAIDGITVTLEDTSVHTFDYYPMAITVSGDRDNLDQGIKLNFGDLGQVLPAELDALFAADGFVIKPTLTYRTYRSDDLSAPLYGPAIFLVEDISFTKEGATIQAASQRLNQTSTGQLYTIDRFPMLRGFL
jgi:hypothetical protein